MRLVLSLILLIALAGCEVGTREIVVWPGMGAKQFNQLNEHAGGRLRMKENDWIGINSPVLLVFRYQGSEMRVEDVRRGGGIMITTTTGYLPDGSPAALPTVDSINFNIGGGMENIAEFHPKLTDYCEQLAAMAGNPKPVLPSAKEISAGFGGNVLNDAPICSGDGADFTYSISASHYAGHWRHGGDHSYGFLNGSLHGRLNWNAAHETP